MTKEKALNLGDMLLKFLIGALIALATFALNNVSSGITDLKNEIKSMRIEMQQLSIDVATVQTRLNYHEQMERTQQ